MPTYMIQGAYRALGWVPSAVHRHRGNATITCSKRLRRRDQRTAPFVAPTSLGAQMFAQGTICKMVAQCTQQGKSIDQAIEFAQSELEGFMRT